MKGPEVLVSDLRGEAPLPPATLERVRAAAAAALEAEGRAQAQLSVTLVDDTRMAALHLRYLQQAGPTDVLAFPLAEEDDCDPLLGEVVVSVDTADREAKARGLASEEELLRYVIHGTLHLLGYDDHQEEERARMHRRQETLLAAFLSEIRGAALLSPPSAEPNSLEGSDE